MTFTLIQHGDTYIAYVQDAPWARVAHQNPAHCMRLALELARQMVPVDAATHLPDSYHTSKM